MDTKKSKELWDRLENEPERAYRAFERYLTLPSTDRTLLEAYRQHVGNPLTAKPSDTWSRWSSQFAWRERATTYDDRLASIRRQAYERAMECLEDEDWVSRNLRASDVMQIMRLHMDAVKAFGVEVSRAEDDWTEEDEAEFADIINHIEEEENPEEASGEEDSEPGCSDKTG